jgi:hypothetical protein
MAIFITLVRYFPFWAIPVCLILVELTLFFYRRKKWILFVSSVLTIVLLIFLLFKFFTGGGFDTFLPMLENEIKVIKGTH